MSNNVVSPGTELAELRAELDRERRRNAELERRIGELDRTVAELRTFARDVSHDLKAPLAGICGYAQLLEHLDIGYPRPAEYDEFVAEINRCTVRMRQLIDDVLTYATTQEARLHLAPIDLAALVDDLVADAGELIRPAPQVSREPLPAVRGDHGMLRRLMENLVGNAIKYVPHGEIARVHVSARRLDGGMVRIEVTDRGIGIPDGQHEAIFEELHRAHPDAYPGNGLGLPICRRIVQRLGGAIGADPQFRGGARIWFTLPMAATLGEPPVAAAPELDLSHTSA
ncbi:ATP-binding protein [Actinoplanes sp. NPDC020271]|uniref:sensor histidine kinase n=1 Tax=Actinoplanes sp. NPDC020271 TaxID=3363896 RepID=UPI00379CFF1F